MHLPVPRTLLLIPALVAMSSVAQAQVTTGAFSVQVTDRATGQVLKTATITLQSPALFQPRTYKADATGTARAVLLPVGNYEATVSAPNYLSAKILDLRVGLGANLSQNVTLLPTNATAEYRDTTIVTVIAASADLDGGVDVDEPQA